MLSSSFPFLLEIKLEQTKKTSSDAILRVSQREPKRKREENVCIDEFGNIFRSLTTLSSIMIKAKRRGKAEKNEEAEEERRNDEKEKNRTYRQETEKYVGTHSKFCRSILVSLAFDPTWTEETAPKESRR